ncbi:MAG TPA: hypothetical protein VMM78_02590 [Thermomicrobiales bacterium]|nr:hypothetical protein [Thermomicrobiales bacterium]
MPYDTQTLPGTLTKGPDGEQIASGWCLIAYDMTELRKPLPEWRGEIALSADDYATVTKAGGELYLRLKPYGGVFEPWHGPVTVEPVEPEHDPVQRRLRLKSAGPLIRTYEPEPAAG